MLSRAQGCLLGLLCGDALGSLVEFKSPHQIRDEWPEGVRDLVDGGTWNTLAGQPTDDGEMALTLARQLVADGSWSAAGAAQAYLRWFRTQPFDMGNTVQQALRGLTAEPDGDPLDTAQFHGNHESQANGALMRIAPLGIFGALGDLEKTVNAALLDAALTHPHHVCRQVNGLYIRILCLAVREAPAPEALYRIVVESAMRMDADPAVLRAIEKARTAPPSDFVRQQGWVLIAFQNAIYQLLHAHTLEEGVIDTVHRGGDTDTNAAICGALLGALHGVDAIPLRWRHAVLHCRPEAGNPKAFRPRPEFLWPVDALELAESLLHAGRSVPSA
ncbi:MAG: ADP-ribosylglycohydrolase family protein [Candidatus Hydrogenedentes bacterium]|nr:ADP-ribosylglycohydrolase family protein [Candidatus Hydrogenedentota bacterium]